MKARSASPAIAGALACRRGVGVEQREPGRSLRGLPHDLERDVAAHREAGEREALGRRREQPRRDRGHRVVARVVGDEDLAPSSQGGDLRLEQGARAGEARNEHEGLRHVPLCLGRMLS